MAQDRFNTDPQTFTPRMLVVTDKAVWDGISELLAKAGRYSTPDPEDPDVWVVGRLSDLLNGTDEDSGT